jgi:hypothetical protein
MITWMCMSGWSTKVQLMPMLESLTQAQKEFSKENTRNSIFPHVVFLEPVSSTHWTAYIQSETQEWKGNRWYEDGYTKNTIHG